MPDVLDQLNKDHRNIESLLRIIEQEINTFETGERPDYELVQSVLSYLLTYPDLYHHPLEDAVVRKLMDGPGEVDVPGAAELELEHRRIAAAIRRFLAALNNILEDQLLPRNWFCTIAREFVDFQRKHMQMEEVVIFPAAKRAFCEDEWTAINDQMILHNDPLFGLEPDVGFAELHVRLSKTLQG